MIKKLKAKKNIKNYFVPLIIISLLGLLFYTNMFKGEASSFKHTKEGNFLIASGIVENNAVMVSGEVPGTLKEFYIKEGDTVSKGQPIAKIDDTILQKQYSQAENNVKIAETKLSAIEIAIENMKIQNKNQINQAQNVYAVANAQYEKIKSGARPQEIEQVRKAMEQLRSVYENAKENLKRMQALFDEGAISKQKYDEVKAGHDVAKAQYEAAKEKLSLLEEGASAEDLAIAMANVSQAESAYEFIKSTAEAQFDAKEKELELTKTQLKQTKTALAQAKDQLDKALIKAPIDGLISVKYLNIGEMTSLGMPVVEILDTGDTRLDVYIAESDIGHIKLIQESKVFIDSFPDKTYSGQVIEISNKAEFTPKNIQTKKERVNTVFKVTVKVMDSNGEVKPGMPADVEIKID